MDLGKMGTCTASALNMGLKFFRKACDKSMLKRSGILTEAFRSDNQQRFMVGVNKVFPHV